MTVKKIGLCGVCNPLVDVLLDVSEEELQSFGFEKGTMRLVESEEQAALLRRLAGGRVRQVDGGSVANSVVAFSQLGGTGAMLSSVGTDTLGEFFIAQCKDKGVVFPVAPHPEEPTGSCIVLITPDAERTMRTHLGAALLLEPSALCEETIASCEWLFLEGFVLSNPERGRAVAMRAIELAKAHDVNIAFSLSEQWVLDTQRQTVEDLLPHLDLIFANESEALGLYHTDDLEVVRQKIGQDFKNAAVTRSEKGALLYSDGKEVEVPAVSCSPVDTTGAGDMFAGTYLYFLSSGATPREAGEKACLMASKVISQVGARLPAEAFSSVVDPESARMDAVAS